MQNQRRIMFFALSALVATTIAFGMGGCGADDLRIPREESGDGAGPLPPVDAAQDARDTQDAQDAAPSDGGVDADADACTSIQCGSPPTRVTAGTGFACVLRADATVWCWGSNQYGELGVLPSANDLACGEVHCSPAPRRIDALAGVRDVRAGESFACALKSDDSVWCWGRNGFDVLGHSATLDSACADPPDAGAGSKCNATPTQVTFPANVKIDSIAAGREIACAVSQTDPAGNPSRDVYCWGRNDHASVGIAGGIPQNVATPNKISGFAGDVVAVDVGDNTRQVCAIRKDGTVWCWGDDFQGRIGTIPGTFPGIDCADGQTHDCTPVPQLIRVRGPLPADAGADAGDIGLGATLSGAKQVKLGAGTSCVLSAGGSVWCWGNNFNAGLADPALTGDDHPGARPIAGLPASVSALTRHHVTAFAATDLGELWGWGDNTYGQLGTGSVFGQACLSGLCVTVPSQVSGLKGTRDLAAGDSFFAAITASGALVAWGRNDFAQLGHAPGTSQDATCAGTQCNALPAPVSLP